MTYLKSFEELCNYNRSSTYGESSGAHFQRGTGAGLKSFSVSGSTSGPARVAIADINSDGTLDLIVGITTPGSLSKARVYDYATLAEMLTSNVTNGDSYTAGLFTTALGAYQLVMHKRNSSRVPSEIR